MIVLKDTSLCAIVRDEMINPAGGIQRFVKSIMPHVESGVIVDTGSVDGTRQALEELQGKFTNLSVYDREFKGYDSARNFSLRQVKTKWVLVLDADELIARENSQGKQEKFSINLGFEGLRIMIENGGILGKLQGYNLLPEDVKQYSIIPSNAHNPRLFQRESGWFFLDYLPSGEWLRYRNPKNPKNIPRVVDALKLTETIPPRESKLYHFRASQDGNDIKMRNWYNEKAWKKGKSPSQTEGYSEWKEYNPQRDKFSE